MQIRDYQKEIEKRVEFIRDLLAQGHASGIIFGNSGGKDCALVGILCKLACEDTVAVMMPCHSSRNYGEDMDDGRSVTAQFGIENRTVDLTEVRQSLLNALEGVTEPNAQALTNIAPRLRMTTLYTVAAAENRLVAGTGNRSERYMGYFTKWGDGGCDFNPIADLTVREVYEFLRYLKAPEHIITKAPSAGLYAGQTDEEDMGVTYDAIDTYLLEGKANEEDLSIIQRYHSRAGHKLRMPAIYPDDFRGDQ